jgi:hypothetical protein
MTAEELLVSMRAALAREREAIRRLDIEAVTEVAATKEAVLARLREAPATDRPALVAAIEELKPELRRNLVLLAHARDCLRQAIELCAASGRRPRLTAKL